MTIWPLNVKEVSKEVMFLGRSVFLFVRPLDNSKKSQTDFDEISAKVCTLAVLLVCNISTSCNMQKFHSHSFGI